MENLRTKTEAFQRAELAKLLARCTDEQRALFHKIYPRGVPAKSLEAAYDVCLRTVLKSNAEYEAADAAGAYDRSRG